MAGPGCVGGEMPRSSSLCQEASHAEPDRPPAVHASGEASAKVGTPVHGHVSLHCNRTLSA